MGPDQCGDHRQGSWGDVPGWDKVGPFAPGVRHGGPDFGGYRPALTINHRAGAHINSYGLHDTNRNTVHPPGVGFRAAATDRFHHSDRLGSTRALTDGAGRVDMGKSRARYSAFGQAQLQGPDGDHPTERQFAGAWSYEWEPSATGLGLDYLYQRHDPAIGRFISADPNGLAGGLNLYGYCAGDPVNAVDPDGTVVLPIAARVGLGQLELLMEQGRTSVGR